MQSFAMGKGACTHAYYIMSAQPRQQQVKTTSQAYVHLTAKEHHILMDPQGINTLMEVASHVPEAVSSRTHWSTVSYLGLAWYQGTELHRAQRMHVGPPVDLQLAGWTLYLCL
mmetsp:Transcript_5014/g.10854  ORF Transcript_5014/g.10854 Transcript_5014/m.10854 type:complete len:113 (-) Transcript_5014:1562-1900(-)